MDRFVARMNLEHLQRRLAEAGDQATRENLSRLVAEAEEQLRRADAAHDGRPHSEPGLRAPDAIDDEAEARRRRNISRLQGQLLRELSKSRHAMLARALAIEEDRLRQMRSERKDHDGDDEAAKRDRIAGIVERLQLETELTQRQSLHRSLIEEEDQFGTLARRMDLADAYIADGARRVSALELLSAASRLDGDAARRQHADMNNARQILEIFRSYRATLEDCAKRIDL